MKLKTFRREPNMCTNSKRQKKMLSYPYRYYQTTYIKYYWPKTRSPLPEKVKKSLRDILKITQDYGGYP